METDIETQTSLVYAPEKGFTDFVWAGAVNLLTLAGWGLLFVFIIFAIAPPHNLPKKDKRQGVSAHVDHVREALDQLTGTIIQAIERK